MGWWGSKRQYWHLNVTHHLPSSITVIPAQPGIAQPNHHKKHVSKDYTVGGVLPSPAYTAHPSLQRRNQETIVGVLHQDTLIEQWYPYTSCILGVAGQQKTRRKCLTIPPWSKNQAIPVDFPGLLKWKTWLHRKTG